MKTKELVKNKNNCCGCSACASVCPKNAITMKTDGFGFIYPVIDEKKCIDCKACINSCTFQSDFKGSLPVKVFGAGSINKKQTQKSASAGIFYNVANKFLENGGVVFGVAFDKDFKPVCALIENKNNLKKLQGSKYVQAFANNLFEDVYDKLKSGKKVLFCGTPCQVASLKNFPKIKDKLLDNLYLIDIVCHGIPSYNMFCDYIKYIEGKNKFKIKEFNFRDKDLFGQSHNGSMITVKNGKEKKQKLYSYKSSYYSLFLKCLTFRDSCYSCKYACDKRVGDLTLCDFWGIENYPEVLSGLKKEGCSAYSGVMVGNKKGYELLNGCLSKLKIIETELNNVKKENPQLNKHSTLNNQEKTTRNKILSAYKENGYSGVEKTFRKTFGIEIFIKTVAKLLPKKLVKIIVGIIKR